MSLLCEEIFALSAETFEIIHFEHTPTLLTLPLIGFAWAVSQVSTLKNDKNCLFKCINEWVEIKTLSTKVYR